MPASLASTAMSSNPNPDFDEQKWVNHVRRSLEEETEIDIHEIPVCIFSVPKILLSTDPNSYIPQEVAIGPYHYWRPEVYELERYKLAAAKRDQKELLQQGIKLHDVVEQLKKMATRIRACYHKFLNFSNETLAWMMVIDASFLLEFLTIYAIKEGKIARDESGDIMSHLVDYAGKKSAHNAILRDMVMIENQIPLFVLRKRLEVQYSSSDLADDMLRTMLIGFCEELSPFRITKNAPKPCVSECYHLLDYLYGIVVSKHKQIQNPPAIITEEDEESQHVVAMGEEKGLVTDSGNAKTLMSDIWKIMSKINIGPIKYIKKASTSRYVKVFLKLPWTKFSKVPKLSAIAQPIQHFFFSQESGEKDPEDGSSSSSNDDDDDDKAPLVEEITIPSISELIKSKVRISPTKSGNLSRIRFDIVTATLHLPPISLDINTEAVIRNLLAYESSNEFGPLIFTRYTELMNGIIDTEEDVKLLRERGIILNRLKSDADVANLWNGMTKSIRLTKVPLIDKVIEDVNRYYNSRWRVKMRNHVRLYVFESWKVLTTLATMLLLLLMTLQAVCSVYSCSRLFGNNKSDE